MARNTLDNAQGNNEPNAPKNHHKRKNKTKIGDLASIARGAQMGTSELCLAPYSLMQMQTIQTQAHSDLCTVWRDFAFGISIYLEQQDLLCFSGLGSSNRKSCAGAANICISVADVFNWKGRVAGAPRSGLDFFIAFSQ